MFSLIFRIPYSDHAQTLFLSHCDRQVPSPRSKFCQEHNQTFINGQIMSWCNIKYIIILVHNNSVGDGRGERVEPPITFSKGRLDSTSILRGGLLEKRG